MKKVALILGGLIIVGIVVYFLSSRHLISNTLLAKNSNHSVTNSNSQYDANLASIKWLQRYPQLKIIPAGSMTANINKLRTSESISELIGPIDNPYGVRNDILDKILSIVPESNPQMIRAAIYSAYYANMAYYSQSDESKLYYARKTDLSGGCLADVNIRVYNKIIHTIDAGMHDIGARIDWT